MIRADAFDTTDSAADPELDGPCHHLAGECVAPVPNLALDGRSLRYVHGRMTTSEVRTFEIELLGDPCLAREVELDLYLRDGFASLGGDDRCVVHCRNRSSK